MPVDLFVAAFRFLVPLTILRWPLFGAFLTLAADTVDVFLLEGFGFGFWTTPNYHILDKGFDTWGLTIEWWVSRRWTDPRARRAAAVLYGWRICGVALAALTGWRGWLLFAPNVFEYFFIYVLIAQRLSPGFLVTRSRLTWSLAVIGIYSFAKEYIMHYRQFSTWAFARDYIFFWLYQ